VTLWFGLVIATLGRLFDIGAEAAPRPTVFDVLKRPDAIGALVDRPAAVPTPARGRLADARRRGCVLGRFKVCEHGEQRDP
jgi:hypothetical protein